MRPLPTLLLFIFTLYTFSYLMNRTRRFASALPTPAITVLVTGAGGSGLGPDLVRILAGMNVHVVAGIKREEHLGQFKEFKNVRAVRLDVTNRTQVNDLVGTLRDVKLYAVVNNAGAGKRKGIEDAEGYVEALREVFEINYFGLAYLTARVLPLLENTAKSVGAARIVNVGSLMGTVHTPNCGAYCSSKFALEALTADWRLAFEPKNISVSMLEPGFFASGMCTETFCLEDPPSVCSAKILLALFDEYPAARYQCARVFGVPAVLISAIINVTPDRVVDLILKAVDPR